MAKNKSTVFLGYEDEEVTPKYVGLLNSSVNKIGGYPDWPSGEIKVPPCILCGRTRCLIVQIYAPLEQSQFHRTLYIFSCVNSLCSQNSKSWSCIRTQHLVGASPVEVITETSPKNSSKSNKKKKTKQGLVVPQKINWCNGADDWGEDSGADFCEEMDTEADDVQPDNEENGNIIAKNDNSPVRAAAVGGSLDNSEEEDDEDESTSMENDLIYGLAQIEMNSPQNPSGHDPNANCAAAIGGEVNNGDCNTVVGFAEIEASENDVVFVETPKMPERDLIALMNSSGSQNAGSSLNKISDMTLKSYFIAVDVEQKYNDDFEHYEGTLSAEHIRELYQEYKRQDENATTPNSMVVSGASTNGPEDQETYEKSLPAHGDLIFHQFLSVIQQNPGQLLRYSRDTLPLLIAPLKEHVPKCPNCNGETICEVQILSTIIPKLCFQQNNETTPIEFGNVLVFTCLKSCWDTPDKMRYERVIVQAEN